MADDMDRWYISKNYKNLTQAGNKAKTDVEQIMAQNGFENIVTHQDARGVWRVVEGMANH